MSNKNRKRVVVGMSGGVDSTVTAYLLKKEGYEVIGLFMKNWDEKDANGVCQSSKEYAVVEKVCNQLDIPYYSIDFCKEYWDNVFQTFIERLQKGETPNPDILCNREIKFKVFFDQAMLLGADYLATGHYCSVQDGKLLQAIDPVKDQTYFLYGIDKKVLNKVLFPLGGLLKSEVRDIAKELNLVNHDKKDSTGICFIGERNFANFIGNYIKKSKGIFIDEEGNILGDHDGLPFYTIGQRKGLNINNGPWFVLSKNLDDNSIVLTKNESLLLKRDLVFNEANWLVDKIDFPLSCQAKIRHSPDITDCIVYADGTVKFLEDQRAISKGQSIVFYNQGICLGGGIIE